MKKTTLSVTFETEKLDALTFYLGKKEIDLQGELSGTLQRLYEKHVPPQTREYLEDKLLRESKPEVKAKPAVKVVPQSYPDE